MSLFNWDENTSLATRHDGGEHGRYQLTLRATGGNKYRSDCVMELISPNGQKTRFNMYSGGNGNGALSGLDSSGGDDADYKLGGFRLGRTGGFAQKDGAKGYSLMLYNSSIANREGRDLFRIHTDPDNTTAGCVAFYSDRQSDKFLNMMQRISPGQKPLELDILPARRGFFGGSLDQTDELLTSRHQNSHHDRNNKQQQGSGGGFFASFFGGADPDRHTMQVASANHGDWEHKSPNTPRKHQPSPRMQDNDNYSR